MQPPVLLPLVSPTPPTPPSSTLLDVPPSPPLSKIPSRHNPGLLPPNPPPKPKEQPVICGPSSTLLDAPPSPPLSKIPSRHNPNPPPKPKEQPVICGPLSAMIIGQKRRLVEAEIEAEDDEVSPHKKAKTLLTSASLRRKPEVEDLHARRVLELARATRATFAAHVQYQRLRTKELELIQAMAIDDSEEAEEMLREAELQAGHIKGALHNGVTFDTVDRIEPYGSDDNSSDGRGSCVPFCKLASPSPSIETSSDL